MSNDADMPTSTVIGSWKKLAEAIEEHSDRTWLFRGEARFGNLLLPKAGRVGTHKDAARKKPHDVSDEIRALEALKRQARPYLQHNPISDVEWLAIAQHHGMSTRLLDWTESLMVAAWFAVEKSGTRGEGVVYCLRNVPEIERDEENRPFSLTEVKLYRPPHISSRIPAQRSVFTIHPKPTIPFRSRDLTCLRISEDACMDIKKILNACAINEASLFPDLDGLSRHLSWSYKWGKLG